MQPYWYRIPMKFVLVILVLVTNLISAAADDYSKKSVLQLIDDLTQIDRPTIGLDGGALYDGFLVNESSIHLQVGVLGVPPANVPPQMLELVKRGPDALPELLKHLDDRRPTKMEVGNKDKSTSTQQVGVDAFWWTAFSDEYDPRSTDWRVNPQTKNAPRPSWLDGKQKDFTGRYAVRVGDVCYVLIGQIVNRRLTAVRYQPSGGLIVNSPIEAPVLAEQIKNDWGGVNSETLMSSLLSDIHPSDPKMMTDWYRSHYVSGALERLRFYFPSAYNALQGADLKIKKQFEEEETKGNSRKGR